MDRTSIYDELSRIERDVVAGERQLADQERLVLDMKRKAGVLQALKRSWNGYVNASVSATRTVKGSCHSCSAKTVTRMG